MGVEADAICSLKCITLKMKAQKMLQSSRLDSDYFYCSDVIRHGEFAKSKKKKKAKRSKRSNLVFDSKLALILIIHFPAYDPQMPRFDVSGGSFSAQQLY